MESRNKREGKYKAYRYGKYFRSLKKLIAYTALVYGNPFYSDKPKQIK